MVNKVTLIGRLGQYSEIRILENCAVVAIFYLASIEYF